MNCEVDQSPPSPPHGEELDNGRRQHGKCQLEVFLLILLAIVEEGVARQGVEICSCFMLWPTEDTSMDHDQLGAATHAHITHP